MDANTQNTETQITNLVARAQASRDQLGLSVESLKSKADIPSRVKAQFRSRPSLWFGVAAVGGIVLARIIRRPKYLHTVPAKKSSAKKWIFDALLSAAKPSIQSWLTSEVKKRLSARMQKAQISSPSSPYHNR